MVWVNIDVPTKKYTLHSSPTCWYTRSKLETQYKGINEMKRDGGWIEFDSRVNALARHQIQYEDYHLVEHC